MAYELFYWPDIQGRGEFVRLALEYAGVEYTDVARSEDGSGPGAMEAVLAGAENPRPPFAVPALRDGEIVVAQTANILAWLSARHGLAPADEAGRLWTHQLQLTLCDWIDEIHDTHHPVGAEVYYQDQKPEAVRRAEIFRRYRLPKFMGYFERVLASGPDSESCLVGTEITTPDLSLFQIVEGLRYAFPQAMAQAELDYPRVCRVHKHVVASPRITRYLASERRIAFNNNGIFRHYPELDG